MSETPEKIWRISKENGDVIHIEVLKEIDSFIEGSYNSVEYIRKDLCDEMVSETLKRKCSELNDKTQYRFKN